MVSMSGAEKGPMYIVSMAISFVFVKAPGIEPTGWPPDMTEPYGKHKTSVIRRT
jgi:hypothetical protein